MTNREAIKSMRNLDDLISITESEHESVKTAISALEHNSTLIEHISNLQNENTDFFNKLVESERENDKLKAEIEQLKRLSDQQSELNIEQFKQIDNQYQEIEQLKSELHQLTYRNCLRCSHYGKCSINDNFNITNCSDFELKGKVEE